MQCLNDIRHTVQNAFNQCQLKYVEAVTLVGSSMMHSTNEASGTHMIFNNIQDQSTASVRYAFAEALNIDSLSDERQFNDAVNKLITFTSIIKSETKSSLARY